MSCTARAGAVRLSMPPPSAEMYVEAVTSAVRANAAWVPPRGKGALYLRPLLLGTGPILGLGPAPTYTLVVYAAAVGCYFKARPWGVRVGRCPSARAPRQCGPAAVRVAGQLLATRHGACALVRPAACWSMH